MYAQDGWNLLVMSTNTLPTLPGFRYTINNYGVLALYRGLAPTLISSFPKAGIRFGSNAYFKKLLMDENGKLTPGACCDIGGLVPSASSGRKGGGE